MTQQTLNLQLGLSLKDEGIQQVSDNNREWMKGARSYARMYALERGEITSDVVRRYFVEAPHPNCYGALFRKGFEWTGRIVQSQIPSCHGRMIRVWRVK